MGSIYRLNEVHCWMWTATFCFQVQYLKEFGLSTEDVCKLLAFKPRLMGCSIEERWKPLVKYLYYLGVRRDGMKRILIVKPMIFCVDLETTIAPKVLSSICARCVRYHKFKFVRWSYPSLFLFPEEKGEFGYLFSLNRML